MKKVLQIMLMRHNPQESLPKSKMPKEYGYKQAVSTSPRYSHIVQAKFTDLISINSVHTLVRKYSDLDVATIITFEHILSTS